jgi:hypothetical protein
MFQGWDEFFSLMGSAAATLTGLLFIVVTLTGDWERTRALKGIGIYLFPILLGFAVVLACAALALIPPGGVAAAPPLVGLAGLGGAAAAARTLIGIGRRALGDPSHWSDIWCYGRLPGLLYLGLIADSGALWARAGWGAAGLAGILLGLLLLSVRNAWDLLTWMAPRRETPSPPAPSQATDSAE